MACGTAMGNNARGGSLAETWVVRVLTIAIAIFSFARQASGRLLSVYSCHWLWSVVVVVSGSDAAERRCCIEWNRCVYPLIECIPRLAFSRAVREIHCSR